MKYTENYHLPEWEATDRVLRTDFNKTFKDIDDALKANADAIDAEEAAREAAVTELANRSRFTKLAEVNITANTDPVTISLAGIDWNQWDKVHMDFLITNSGTRWMYFNDSSQDSNRFYSFGVGISNTFRLPRLTFDVGFSGNRTVSINLSSQFDMPILSYDQVKKLLITGDVYAGSQIILWGEK